MIMMLPEPGSPSEPKAKAEEEGVVCLLTPRTTVRFFNDPVTWKVFRAMRKDECPEITFLLLRPRWSRLNRALTVKIIIMPNKHFKPLTERHHGFNYRDQGGNMRTLIFSSVPAKSNGRRYIREIFAA